jgi:PAS domain-containing protein
VLSSLQQVSKVVSLLGFSGLVGVTTAGFINLFIWLAARRPHSAQATPTAEPCEIALIFEDSVLVDASDEVWQLLDASQSERPGWDDVRVALKPLVPHLPDRLPKSPIILPHQSGPKVTVDVVGDRIRMSLLPSAEMQHDWFQALQDGTELALMRPAFDHAPNPVWCVDEGGTVLWGNSAYQSLADTYDGPDDFAHHVTEALGKLSDRQGTRVDLISAKTRQTRWFEVTTQSIDKGVLHFATAVDAVVRAEEAQRNFVQTLSKTFANLTTGLAIFDRNRRLALFNPALIDLSGLSAEFLSSRPNLFEFFDKLRDQQIMPEPKNYDSWRERMAKLVAAASDDRFSETWNLVDGQTFDVTGRPYPDGAIAFLFNDITAEVSLTRGFRTELETMQSSLDAMDDAVAIFNQQGVLIASNAAHKTMWAIDPDTCLTEATILDATQQWKAAFHPAPLWPELREFVTKTSERASWDSDLRSRDGREVTCRVDPICYGSTMIRFCYAPPGRAGSNTDEPLQIVSA